MQVAVTESLLDRLEDCKRTFPTVAVLGGAGTALPSCLQADYTCVCPVCSQTSATQQNHCATSVGDVVTSRLSDGRAGITKVLQMDISLGMLQRDQATAQVLPLQLSYIV